jgi:hypothetical protein
MMLRASFVLALTSLVIACGGRADDAASSVQPSPAPSSAPAPGPGPAPMPMPAPLCADAIGSLARACLPPAAKAGAPLRLLAEDDGCWGSCAGTTTTEGCKVTVEGSTVKLDLAVSWCTDGRESQSCTTACMRKRVECQVPALAAGTYRVVTETPQASGMKALDRELVVRDDADGTSCLELPISDD